MKLRELRALADGIAALSQLRGLALVRADLDGTALVALARGARELVELDVADDAAVGDAFDASAFMDDLPPHLERLRLVNLGLTDEHAIAIARSPRAAQLRRLDVSRNPIGERGARALASSENLRSVHRLATSGKRR